MNNGRISPVNRLLMTADTLGGVWTYAMELSRGLRAHGVQVLLATMGAPLNPDQAREAAALDNVEVCSSHYKLEWMEDPWEDVSDAGEWLLELEQRFQPHVVHLNGYVHGALPWSCPCLVAAHSCVLSWWREVRQEKLPSKWEEYQRRVAEGLKSADLVVAPTQAMLNSLQSDYGQVPDAKVIHNGRSPDHFGATRKEPFIFSAGRLWDPAKNISLLASVARRLPWPVLVAGDNTCPNGIESSWKNIEWLGRLSPPALAALYSRAGLYVLPARYEPFGLTVLEAALSRCALVLGDIPSQRELWEGAALFVPPSDARFLEKTVLDLIGDPDRLDSLASRAHARARWMTTRRMSATYAAAYSSLLTQVPQSPVMGASMA